MSRSWLAGNTGNTAVAGGWKHETALNGLEARDASFGNSTLLDGVGGVTRDTQRELCVRVVT